MTATRVFDAVTAYLAIVTTVSTASGVQPFDGPQNNLGEYVEYVIVGCDDLFSAPLSTFNNGEQAFESLGAYERQEQFTIPSVFVAWDGDGNWANCRTTTAAFLTALNTAVLAPPAGSGDGQLNGALGPTGWCWLSVRNGEANPAEGAQLITHFDLNCVTYIS